MGSGCAILELIFFGIVMVSQAATVSSTSAVHRIYVPLGMPPRRNAYFRVLGPYNESQRNTDSMGPNTEAGSSTMSPSSTTYEAPGVVVYSGGLSSLFNLYTYAPTPEVTNAPSCIANTEYAFDCNCTTNETSVDLTCRKDNDTMWDYMTRTYALRWIERNTRQNDRKCYKVTYKCSRGSCGPEMNCGRGTMALTQQIYRRGLNSPCTTCEPTGLNILISTNAFL